MIPYEVVVDYCVGSNFEKVREDIFSMGWKYRIVEKEGFSYAITDDIQLDRLNIIIENGIIIKITVG